MRRVQLLVVVAVLALLAVGSVAQEQQQQQQHADPTSEKKVISAAPTQGSKSVDKGRGFKCIHDTPVIQRMMRDGMDHVIPVAKGQPSSSSSAPKKSSELHGFKAQAVAPIRVVASTADLDDNTKYCTAAGQVRPDFKGGTITCTADDIFTAERKRILTENVLPTALAQIANQLSVEQVTQNIVIPNSACSPFTIPAAHSDAGVSNADYVLYVAAAPSSVGNLAWAGFCATAGDGRPVIGRANFAPRYINWTGISGSSVDKEQVATAVHELLHALGFTSSLFKNTTTVSIRGKTATVIRSPEVLAKARAYFNCPTLAGGEIEDEGGSGSAGAHWDRRQFKDEMMAAAGGETFSEMTLAHMKDTGFYTVDYSKAEVMSWARNAGCGFNTEKCNTVAGGKDEYFCFTEADQCVDQSTAIGYCPIFTYSSALPSHFQYFADPTRGGDDFYDKCPVPTAYGNRRCGETQTATTAQTQFGYYFGEGGMCFDTTGLIQSGLSAPGASTLRCLQSRCKSGPDRIEFQVNGGGWRQCPTNGEAGDVAAGGNYDGSIKCPTAATFCAGLRGTPISTPAPPTPEPPTQAATPIPASPTEYAQDTSEDTITGKLVITGQAASWRQILDSTDGAAALRNAIRFDVGQFSEIDPKRIRIDDTATGSLVVAFAMSGVSSVTGAELQSIFTARAVGTGSWMPNVRGVFHTVSNETIVLSRITAKSVGGSALCGAAYSDTECTTIVTVAAAGLVLLAIILICVCCCCCRTPKPEDRPSRQPVSNTQPEPHAGRRRHQRNANPY